MRKKLLFLLILTVLISTLSAAGGRLFGKVESAKTGEPLAMAVIRIPALELGKNTDEQGKYLFTDLPSGEYSVVVELIGYKSREQKIIIKPNETATINFSLAIEALEMSGSSVNALRSIPGETPVAFTELSNEEISSDYTTQDVPELIDEVPGVFSAGSGLGESELSIRGFDAEKVQVLINGIPVNDPESQKVYWSNWTGVSSNIQSVQVQRGASSSLYGSGAFGGSLNIETMKSSEKAGWTFRASMNSYSTLKFSELGKDTADGKGDLVDYQPQNYNTIIKYDSGQIGRVNFSLMQERKVGDSYIAGTNYNGWSWGAEGEIKATNHTLNLSLIAAPQSHNQARTTSDPDLFEKLGRNYNRSLTGYQENYYFKPQFSIRDEWRLTDSSTIMTNFFVTSGEGGGKYLKNDYFDVDNGYVGPMEADLDNDRRLFGKHAAWIYETTGVMPAGLRVDENNPDFFYYEYQGEEYRFRYTSAKNLIAGTYENSWENDSQNNHKQFGINSYFQNKANQYFELICGYEYRYWDADHCAESNFFHYAVDEDIEDEYFMYQEVQKRYDYSSLVQNLSGFVRLNISPVKQVNLMADVQAAKYHSEVEENPIQIFEFGSGQFLDEYFYTTKEMSENDTLLFEDSDYKRNWDFVSPKFGLNYKPVTGVNMFVNYSIAHKEPKVSDWYSYTYGPNQDGYVDGVQIKELKPEKVETEEFGISYRDFNKKLSINVYNTHYLDKIGRVTVPVDGEEKTMTTNYGNATHQGIEVAYNAKSKGFDYNLSGTMSHNRWNKMNAELIGNTPAEDFIGNVVPFAPERMASGELGYTWEYLPNDGKLRLGMNFKWWDEYYCNEENVYTRPVIDSVDTNGITHYKEEEFSSKLPYYFSIGAEVDYNFKIWEYDCMFKLVFNNLNNREENYTKGYVGTDYGRNDYLLDEKNLYVVPAPLFNMASTIEIKF